MKVLTYETITEDGLHLVSIVPLKELGPYKILKIQTGPRYDKTIVSHALGVGLCGSEKLPINGCKDYFRVLKKQKHENLKVELVKNQHEEVLSNAEILRREALLHYGCIV